MRRTMGEIRDIHGCVYPTSRDCGAESGWRVSVRGMKEHLATGRPLAKSLNSSGQRNSRSGCLFFRTARECSITTQCLRSPAGGAARDSFAVAHNRQLCVSIIDWQIDSPSPNRPASISMTSFCLLCGRLLNECTDLSDDELARRGVSGDLL